jgi:hypothetical protein
MSLIRLKSFAKTLKVRFSMSRRITSSGRSCKYTDFPKNCQEQSMDMQEEGNNLKQKTSKPETLNTETFQTKTSKA